jgi:putative Holliday junction resolvase
MIQLSLQEFCTELKKNSPLLCIDYGLKKLGFAISDPGRKLAMPLEVAVFKDEKSKIPYISNLISKHNISGIVIGLPINMDGTDSSQSELITKFAKLLSEDSNQPIFLQDERLSTKAAQSLLRSAGIKRKIRDEIDDKISASYILETVIDSMRHLD